MNKTENAAAPVTNRDRAEKLAEMARAELAAFLPRAADSCTWTQREYGLLTWMVGKARVTVDSDRSVSIVTQTGRTAERLGWVLYSLLERASNELDNTPYAISYDHAEGHHLPNGGKLTW